MYAMSVSYTHLDVYKRQVLNRSDFYVEDALVNKGRGRNIGIDITLERFLEKGLYYMISGSLRCV